jgi:hypothetical protein
MIAVKLLLFVLVSALAVRWLWKRQWFRILWWVGTFVLLGDFLWETANSLHLMGR